MRKAEIQGKHYVNLVRCSTDRQAETSIPDQLAQLDRIAKENGGIHAGNDIILDGVSGSKPGGRTDFDELIERKKTKDDFSVLFVLSEDRITRSGSDHASYAKVLLLKHGITIVYAMSDIPDGPYKGLMQILKHESGNETVKTTGMRSAQGAQRALENGNIVTSSHTNYGLHRLYKNRDGQDICIIRDNRDGTQDRLDPVTREFKESYGTVGKGNEGHYRKQKSDQVFLVPGDPKEIEVVQYMMRRRWIDGIGGVRIAKALNYDLKVPAPQGGLWTQRQVEVIAEVPVYFGRGAGKISSTASYFQRGKVQPEPVELDQTERYNRKNPRRRLRPPQDWEWKEEPYLADFFPEPLRTIGFQKVVQILEARCDPDRPKRLVNNKHQGSDYLLTGILTALQDGRLLKGQNSGPKEKRVRYYAHALARKDPIAAGFPNTTFRSDVLEQAVLQCWAATLASSSDLRPEIEHAVQAFIAQQQPPTDEDVATLTKQSDALSKKITQILKMAGDDVEEATALIADLYRQKREISNRIERANVASDKVPYDVEAIVDSLVARFIAMAPTAQSMPNYPLRQVLKAMTVKMTADMVTREVEWTLRVPENAISDVKTAFDQLCLQSNLRSPTSWEAQFVAQSVIATIRCTHERKDQKQCYSCRRLPKAA